MREAKETRVYLAGVSLAGLIPLLEGLEERLSLLEVLTKEEQEVEIAYAKAILGFVQRVLREEASRLQGLGTCPRQVLRADDDLRREEEW